MGVDFGDTQPPTPENPRGSLENVLFRDIVTKAYLEALGGDGAGLIWPTHELSDFPNLLPNLIKRTLAYQGWNKKSPIGLKDPKFLILAEGIDSTLRNSDIEPIWVFAYRVHSQSVRSWEATDWGDSSILDRYRVAEDAFLSLLARRNREFYCVSSADLARTGRAEELDNLAAAHGFRTEDYADWIDPKLWNRAEATA
jgi:hypothetical protein